MRIDLQGVPCMPYRVWVCSKVHITVTYIENYQFSILLSEEFWNIFYSYHNVGLMNAHKRWDVKVIRRLKHGIPPNGFKSFLKFHSNSNVSLIAWWIFYISSIEKRCYKAFFSSRSPHISRSLRQYMRNVSKSQKTRKL